MSIRGRLALWIAIAIFATTMVFCAVRHVIVRNMMVADFEKSSLEQLNAVANSVKVWTNGDVYVELNPALLTGFAAGGDRAFVVRNVTDQMLIAQSISLDSSGTTIVGLHGANRAEPVFGKGIAPNGAEAVVVTQIMPAQWDWDLDDADIEVAPEVLETYVEITLALDRTDLTSRLNSLAFLTVILGLASSSTAAMVVLLTVRRVLRPLQDLADHASEIKELSYDAPFPTDGPAELRPIALRLNDLLVRLTDASLAERRFTSDAAHELRTPVAELRTLTEVALRFPTAPEQLENVIKSSNDISTRLTSLIDALLGIARKDALSATLQLEPVNPPEMVRQIVADNARIAAGKALSVDLTAPQYHEIITDVTLLQSVLRNLIANAIAHAPKGADIQISYDGSDDEMCFAISNPAPDMTADDVAHVFEPFWRKNGHCSHENHSGLGLALCKSFAEVLGFDLDARLLPQQVFEVTLRALSSRPSKST